MSFRSFRMLTFLIGMAIYNQAIAVEFGPGEAAARFNPPSSGSEPAQGHADFKVLVWYRRADPLATFKYQVYDLRKGEFTPAVDGLDQDRATRNTRRIPPSYATSTSASRKGRPTMLKVGAVIKRELTVAAALSGVILGSPINSGGRPFESLRNSGSEHQPANRLRLERPEFLEPKSNSFPSPHALPPASSVRWRCRAWRASCMSLFL